jgi:hypothetical protein
VNETAPSASRSSRGPSWRAWALVGALVVGGTIAYANAHGSSSRNPGVESVRTLRGAFVLVPPQAVRAYPDGTCEVSDTAEGLDAELRRVARTNKPVQVRAGGRVISGTFTGTSYIPPEEGRLPACLVRFSVRGLPEATQYDVHVPRLYRETLEREFLEDHNWSLNLCRARRSRAEYVPCGER